MTKIINRISLVIFICTSVVCYANGSCIRNNTRSLSSDSAIEQKDTVYIQSSGDLVICSGQITNRVKLPEVIGYEDFNIYRNECKQIVIKYSSSNHVSLIFMFIDLVKDDPFFVTHLVMVSPCQTCDPFTIKTYEMPLNIALDNEDKSDFFEDLIDEQLLSNQILSRKLVESIKLNELLNYSSNIQEFEYSISVELLEGVINEQPILNSNVVKYNDLAFDLARGKAFEQSSFLLERIIAKFPNRTVAYINLGDAYWGLKEKDNAKQAYQKYIELMKASSKESKIPERVFERVK
ncbi:hypothetical protein BZG01_19760 [Labilibaculum manganireducens]|uniref:Uncharacterized protein n=1 Tax=Labilibaculum manganireducens TaxID=1940525 RepID=A0A2N3HT14_9BACT|nr:tetratricopeptide repeat protein [Labilibaculum manganireducens]PKQ61187.1 hypothetical protein BZG01_19760 [Labilibaculum manganireducens]